MYHILSSTRLYIVYNCKIHWDPDFSTARETYSDGDLMMTC